MVECTESLDLVFHSFADATRRDILKRLSRAEQTISQLAKPYAMSLAAIAKHVSVLERAGLVSKERAGKEKVVKLVPTTIQSAEEHLSQYEKIWTARFDALEDLLNTEAERTPKWPRSKSRRQQTRRT